MFIGITRTLTRVGVVDDNTSYLVDPAKVHGPPHIGTSHGIRDRAVLVRQRTDAAINSHIGGVLGAPDRCALARGLPECYIACNIIDHMDANHGIHMQPVS